MVVLNTDRLIALVVQKKYIRFAAQEMAAFVRAMGDVVDEHLSAGQNTRVPLLGTFYVGRHLVKQGVYEPIRYFYCDKKLLEIGRLIEAPSNAPRKQAQPLSYEEISYRCGGSAEAVERGLCELFVALAEELAGGQWSGVELNTGRLGTLKVDVKATKVVSFVFPSQVKRPKKQCKDNGYLLRTDRDLDSVLADLNRRRDEPEEPRRPESKQKAPDPTTEESARPQHYEYERPKPFDPEENERQLRLLKTQYVNNTMAHAQKQLETQILRQRAVAELGRIDVAGHERQTLLARGEKLPDGTKQNKSVPKEIRKLAKRDAKNYKLNPEPRIERSSHFDLDRTTGTYCASGEPSMSTSTRPSRPYNRWDVKASCYECGQKHIVISHK